MDLANWRTSYEDLPTVGITTSATVEGLCKKATGGRFLFAKVQLAFAPAETLVLRVAPSLDVAALAECQAERWIDSLWLGVLDTMLVVPLAPITVFSCTLVSVETHPVDSGRDAFRLAGRNGGCTFLRGCDYVTL